MFVEGEMEVVGREPGVYGRRESSMWRERKIVGVSVFGMYPRVYMWRERWKCLCIGRNGCCGHVCEQGKRLFLFGCGSTLCIGRDKGVVGVFVDRETQCMSLCVFVERLENVIMYLCRDRFVCGETGACLNREMCLCVCGVRDEDVEGERGYW